MKHSESILPDWQQHYGKGPIKVSNIKNHHLNKHTNGANINWSTTCMLIGTTASTYRTIVVDTDQGMYAVKPTPRQLLNQLSNINPLMDFNTVTRLEEHLGIKEYRPFACASTCFTPLKKIEGCPTSYLALHQIHSQSIGRVPNTIEIHFNDCDVPYSLDISHHFLHQRELDHHNILLHQEKLLDYFKSPFEGNTLDKYQLHKHSQSMINYEKIVYGFKRATVEKVMQYFDIEPNEKDIDEIIKSLMNGN